MLDTDIWIYFAKNRFPQATARFERLKPDQPVMSAITYGELQHGANKSTERSRTRSQLAELIQ
jgi:tRNA(fMet)-specific endonuclease VapC